MHQRWVLSGQEQLDRRRGLYVRDLPSCLGLRLNLDWPKHSWILSIESFAVRPSAARILLRAPLDSVSHRGGRDTGLSADPEHADARRAVSGGHGAEHGDPVHDGLPGCARVRLGVVVRR